MKSSQYYIFCDIDGTLLHAEGTGRPAFRDAFFDAYGLEIDVSQINFAGATDLGVLAKLQQSNGVAPDEEKGTLFFERLAVHMERYLEERPPVVYSGVVSFLERVSSRYTLALVSGNTRRTAFLKLRFGGLLSYFSEVGGFGDDHGDRSVMAALALERAGNPHHSFLLGDTPSDCKAAQANNIFSVAVCNGFFGRDELESEEPDLVIDSFEDPEPLYRVLGV